MEPFKTPLEQIVRKMPGVQHAEPDVIDRALEAVRILGPLPIALDHVGNRELLTTEPEKVKTELIARWMWLWGVSSLRRAKDICDVVYHTLRTNHDPTAIEMFYQTGELLDIALSNEIVKVNLNDLRTRQGLEVGGVGGTAKVRLSREHAFSIWVSAFNEANGLNLEYQPTSSIVADRDFFELVDAEFTEEVDREKLHSRSEDSWSEREVAAYNAAVAVRKRLDGDL